MCRDENQLDVTECFIALMIRSTYFGHFYAHHQELETIFVLLSPMVCSAWLLVVGCQVQTSWLSVQEEGCCTSCSILLPGCSRPATGRQHRGYIKPQAVTQQSSAPEDGQNNCPKHVELTGIINKPLLLHLVGCLYYLYFIIFFWDLLNNLIFFLYRMSCIS